MNAPASSPYVDDLKVDYRGAKGKRVTENGYGPENVKSIANYEAVGRGGWFPQRNGKESLNDGNIPANRVDLSRYLCLVRSGEIRGGQNWPVSAVIEHWFCPRDLLTWSPFLQISLPSSNNQSTFSGASRRRRETVQFCTLIGRQRRHDVD